MTTDIKLPKNIDKLNLGFILCEKKNVTHALWGIYTIVIGVIAKLIFWK